MQSNRIAPIIDREKEMQDMNEFESDFELFELYSHENETFEEFKLRHIKDESK